MRTNVHPLLARVLVGFDPAEGSILTLQVDAAWTGWSGDTIVQLTDGSVWRQDEYYYEYHYAYRPKVEISNGKMQVAGMKRSIRVRRL